MPRWPVVPLLSAVLLPAVANADIALVPLGELIVAYDTDVWLAAGPSPGDTLLFTCIAVDCEGEPSVFAEARPADGGSDGTFQERLHGYADPDYLDFDEASRQPDIPFVVTSGWSGCRANDAPILTATAEMNGILYWFGNGLGKGCNFGAELPELRFVELIAGVKLPK